VLAGVGAFVCHTANPWQLPAKDRSGRLRIPTNVTACTDERDRSVVRASVEFKF
jgi:hypothetical protein